MRILWNENEKQFEAQFATGDQWQADKDAAQAAGFRTDGPPAWRWYTEKAATLTKLKASASTLSFSPISITREAMDAYNRLRKSEESVEELKEYAKQQKKLQKKAHEREQIKAEQDGEVEPEYEARHYYKVPEYWKGKHEITRGDLPADTLARLSQRESIPLRKAEPIGKCSICGDNLYFPEEPPNCWWCEGRGEEKFLDELF